MDVPLTYRDRTVQGVLCCLLAALSACATTPQAGSRNEPAAENAPRDRLLAVVPAVVGVSSTFKYRVTTYRYVQSAGEIPRDSTSPTGYELLPGREGVSVADQTHDTQGCGVILHSDPAGCVILTSQHVLASPDTSLGYYRDARGRPTDILAFRAVKIFTTHYIVDQNNNFSPAVELRLDRRIDLGLVVTKTSAVLTSALPVGIAYGQEPTWGDQVYVFGFPRSSKQVTTGVISPSLNSGTFTVDAAARFGYSGGPVFFVLPGGSLALGGIIRSVPSKKLRYVLPPDDLPSGADLIADDVATMHVGEEDMIEYGSAYAIGAEKLGKFLSESRTALAGSGIVLAPRFLPQQ